MFTEADDALSEWLKKYGHLAAYTTAVVIMTIFLVDSNRAIRSISTNVDQLNVKVDALQAVVHDRERYERWLKQANARLKRLYSARGWEYEEIE